MTYDRKDTMPDKYGDLPAGALFRFADGVNDPSLIYRKLRDNQAGYDSDTIPGRGGVISMSPSDDVEAVTPS
jgi:hypothetical protein